MYEAGRLGNQIFQYAALTQLARPGERIDLFGFRSLAETFTGLTARIHPIEGSPLRHGASFSPDRLARWLPGVATVGEGPRAEVPERPSGWCVLVKPSWFQSGAVLSSPGLASMAFQPAVLASARAMLAGAGLADAELAFLNIRGTDYRTWPSTEHPALLPADWYRSCVSQLLKDRPHARLVVLGDDPAYISEVTKGLPVTALPDSTVSTDLALMSLCQSGVLSASTFAYWGAYFARRNGGLGPFIGPERWVGHSTDAWYPPYIKSDFIEYR